MAAIYVGLKEGDSVGKCFFIEYTGKNHKRALTAKLKCFCGNTFNAALWEVAKYPSRCCGCLKVNRGAKNGRYSIGNYSDGQYKAENRILKGIINRCYNSNESSYPRYGGRGIGVCDRWRGENGLFNFVEDMGKRPSPNHSTDRFPNNKTGHYEPGNCRWATPKQQNLNKRNNILVTYNGKTQAVSEWAAEVGLSKDVIYHRFYKGWPTQDLFVPTLKGSRYTTHPSKHICLNPPFQPLIISAAKYKIVA